MTTAPPAFAHSPALIRLGDLEVVRLGYGAMRLPGPGVWGEPEIGLAWLLARSPIMLPIPGTSRPEHLEENWEARTIHLEPEEVESIAAAARAD